MRRREFLITTTIGATSTLLFEGCGHKEEAVIPLLVSEESLPVGAERWTSGLCGQCPAGCGIKVRTMLGERRASTNGHAVRVMGLQAKKIEGNPEYPVNRGKLCARGQAGLQVLYHPDRLKGPLVRTGARGAGQFRPIGWDEALALLAQKLRELRHRNEPHGLLFMTGHLQGHRKTMVSRFMEAYGSPNHILYELLDEAALRRANEMTMGHRRLPVFDLERTNYLISFGAGFLETFLSPVQYSLGFGTMRQGHPGRRAKIVQIEPRFSLTAANADEWIPARPGTEGTLALGIAYVLIEEDLYDKAFVARLTHGFERFKDLVLAHFRPEDVALATDVPAERIRRVAREFARHRPSLAIGGGMATAQPHGLFTSLAINALNALVGSLGQPGGIFFDPFPPLSQLPPVERDAIAREGLGRPPVLPPGASVLELPKRILSADPYPIQVALFYNTNPLFTMPESAHFARALERIPFLVSFSSFMDETSMWADLILPDHTFLESWWDDVPEPGVGFPVVGLSQPVVSPLWDTRSTPDVLIQLAHRCGETVARAFPWETFADMLKAAYRGLFEARRGSIREDDFETFWEQMRQSGGWWDADVPLSLPVRTPTGKYEFQLGGPLFPRPIVEPASGAESEFPFHFYPYPSLAFFDGRCAHLPWLQEMPDPQTTVCWGSWVEMNPQTAEKLGLAEGDLVWIESSFGKIQAPVVLFPGLRPDTIAMPMGQGHTEYGRYAQRRGANPIRVLVPAWDSATGAVAWAATRVKVSKAPGTGRVVKIGFDRPLASPERR